MTTARISLDSPVFSGRLRTFERRSTYERRPVYSGRPEIIADVRTVPKKQQPQPSLAKVKRVANITTTTPTRTSKSLVLKRQTVLPPTAKKRKSLNWRGSLQKKSLTALAILLFVVGIGVAVDGLLTNRHVEAQVEQIQASNQTAAGGGSDAPMVGEVPSEDHNKPDVTVYRTAADAPRIISVPKLGIQARVLKLGIDKKGAVAAPVSIHDAGWYDGSSKPGQPGAMLIDGHVHGPTQPGVFANLKNIKPGDEIAIERGDGKNFTYKVVKTKAYPADSMDMMGAALTPVTPGKPGLNLITCTGELDASGNHYKDRLVVFAEQK